MSAPEQPLLIPEDIITRIWSDLAHCVRDAAHPWRTPALASMADEGAPDVRTIVLRRVDPAKRALWFHTDLRSSKVFQLRHNPRVTWLFWSPATQIQIRMHATAKLDADAIDAKALWGETTPRVREAYRSTLTPGEPLEAMLTYRPVTPGDGFENFLVIETKVNGIDWLQLDPVMHRRLRVTWVKTDQPQFQWIAP